MAMKLKWPMLGIIIPCILIATLGYGSHIMVFKNRFSKEKQVGFEISLSILWLSYLLAIYAEPGSPPDKFAPLPGEWRRYCKKCKNYKPERTHHCKVCKKCVLKMDHHCPWTMNCVGHSNMGHFMRFLFWIMINTGFVLIELSKRALEFYEDRELPSYLINKWELAAVIVLLPLDLFVLFSIVILYVRCLINWVFRGMSQIEVWEHERIDSQFFSERMWLQIRKNYYKLNGKPMPELTSWNQSYRTQTQQELELDDMDGSDDTGVLGDYSPLGISAATEGTNSKDQSSAGTDSVVPKNFTMDDLIFPYDLGIWGNAVQTFNQPWWWLWPFTVPLVNGYHWEKNEFADDDQLSLPWPPDGGNQEFEPDGEVDLKNLTAAELRNIKHLRKRLDPRSKLDRKDWMNDLGETLDDFGVDLDAEDVENDDLLAKATNQ